MGERWWRHSKGASTIPPVSFLTMGGKLQETGVMVEHGLCYFSVTFPARERWQRRGIVASTIAHVSWSSPTVAGKLRETGVIGASTGFLTSSLLKEFACNCGWALGAKCPRRGAMGREQKWLSSSICFPLCLEPLCGMGRRILCSHERK